MSRATATPSIKPPCSKKGVPALSLAATEDHFDSELFAHAIIQRLRAPGYQPPLVPDTALQLMNLARRPDSSAREIARLLEADAVLAASVLRVANSAAYCAATPVRSLQEAIVRLGTRTIATIFFAVWSNAKLFRVPGYEPAMAVLRRHGLATAHVARLVTRQTTHDPEVAFLCGLLHDVGTVLGFLMIAEERRGKSQLAAFEIVSGLHRHHGEIGATLCTLWRLPDEVAHVVRHHHAIAATGVVQPINAVVRIAENLVSRAGVHCPTDAEDLAEEVVARDALGISHATYKRVEAEANALLAQLSD